MLAEGSYHELQSSDLNFTKVLGSLAETTVATEINSNKTGIGNVYSRQLSIISATSSVEEPKAVQGDQQKQPVEIAETRTSGTVSSVVYSSYFSAGGSICKIVFLFFICIFTQALVSGGDYWITYW